MKGKLNQESTLKALAQKYGKTPAQIILRWDIQNQIVTIPKSVTPERIRENADIFDFELSEDNNRALYVPERFAHGYQVLRDKTETSYQVGEFYTPSEEFGLSPYDPGLGLGWPIETTEISEKDAAWAPLADVLELIKQRMAVPALEAAA